jgi:hypothetical protein
MSSRRSTEGIIHNTIKLLVMQESAVKDVPAKPQ